MNFFEILNNVQNQDASIRRDAEKLLEIKEKENIFFFFNNLISIVSNEKEIPERRRLSGLILKNRIDDYKFYKNKTNNYKWYSLFIKDQREHIKKKIITILFSASPVARRISAQIFSKIAILELTEEQGCEIFSKFYIIIKEYRDIYVYNSILEIIEFVCYESNQDPHLIPFLLPFSTIILHIILPKIEESQKKGLNLVFAALKAFYTVIPLLKKNFLNHDERNYIFRLVINQIFNPDIQVRILIFEILGKIAQIYYDFLEDFIPIIFDISIKTIQTDEEPVSLQTIELWSTIADKEFEINTKSLQSIREGVIPYQYSRQYTNRASNFLSTLLLGNIKNLYIKNDFEEWNLGTASAVCLNQMSQVAPYNIIPQTILFIQKGKALNERKDLLKYTIVTLLSIFDGLGTKLLYGNVYTILSYLMTNSNEYKIEEKFFIFWFFGKITSCVPYLIRDFLGKITKQALELFQKNTIHKNLLWTINELLHSFGKKGILDWCFRNIFISPIFFLLKGIPSEHCLDEIFEILCSCIINSSGRNKCFLISVFPFYLKFFSELLKSERSSKITLEKKIQSHLCRTIGLLIQKLSIKINTVFIEEVLDLLGFFTKNFDSEFYNWALEEEILVCISSIAQNFVLLFEARLNYWGQYLFLCLKKNQNYQITNLSIGIIGDISRTIGKVFEPFLNDFTETLLNHLKKEDCNSEVKTIILVSIGDLAFSMNNEFYSFSTKTIGIFKEEGIKIINNEIHVDPKCVELNLNLKDSILEGITGIIQNFPSELNKKNSLEIFQKLIWLPDFIFFVLSKNRLSRAIEICIGLIGDLCLTFLDFKKWLSAHTWVKQLIFEAKNNLDSRKNILGKWGQKSLFDF